MMTRKEIAKIIGDIKEAVTNGDLREARFKENELHYLVLYGIAYQDQMRGDLGKATVKEIALEAIKSRQIEFQRRDVESGSKLQELESKASMLEAKVKELEERVSHQLQTISALREYT